MSAARKNCGRNMFSDNGMVKFNCSEMDSAVLAFKSASAKLYACAESLGRLCGGLEAEQRHEAGECVENLKRLAYRAGDMACKLKLAAEIYRGADRMSAETAERLPAAIAAAGGLPGGLARAFNGEYTVSQTMPAGLFVEDWLLNLMYADNV